MKLDEFGSKFLEYDKSKFLDDSELKYKIDKDKLKELLKMQEKIERELNIHDIRDRIKLIYIFGMLKIDEAQLFLINKGYIDEHSVWLLKDYEEENVEYVKNKYLQAIDYLERAVNMYDKKYDDIKPTYDDSNNKIRRSYQDLAYLGYNSGNNEMFIEYAEEAVKRDSIGICSMLEKYYFDQDDYNLGYKYFRKTISISIDYKKPKQNVLCDETYKLLAYSNMYHNLFDRGLYKEAKVIVEELKEFTPKLWIKEFDNKDISEIVKDWTNECNERIALSLTKPSSDKENILKQYFSDDVIQKMNTDIKIYIITSLEIYSYLKDVDTVMDYSATLMPIMKGVESLLYEITVKKYLGYIKDNNIRVNEYEISKNFLYNGTIKENIDRCEYGDALWCIAKPNCQGSGYIPKRYFKRFCIENNVENSVDKIRLFASNLSELKDKRNKIAHKERVFEEDADWCREVLLEKIKFIDFLYRNFGFCLENDN